MIDEEKTAGESTGMRMTENPETDRDGAGRETAAGPAPNAQNAEEADRAGETGGSAGNGRAGDYDVGDEYDDPPEESAGKTGGISSAMKRAGAALASLGGKIRDAAVKLWKKIDGPAVCRGPGKRKLFSWKYFIHDFVKATAVIPGLIWFRPKLIYAGQKTRLHGGALVISNHIGYFDPIYLMFAVWYRRHHFVCSKEFYASKAGSFFFRNFLTIPVDRENFALDSFRQITGELKGGSLVSIFPGGHIDRSEDGVETFKSGAVLMAIKSGAPVMPVLLTKKKHWYSRLTAVIGEPVDLRDICGSNPSMKEVDEVASLLAKLEASLRAFLPENK